MAEKQKLLSVTAKDCKWEFMVASGDGGQNRQKRNTAVRCTHLNSGAVGKCSDGRSQDQNRKTAFKHMIETKEFKKWLQIEVSRKSGELARIEAKVNEEMKKVKVESHDDSGKWKDGLTDPEKEF